MSISRPIQWYHSHVDPIWPDGTFKKESARAISQGPTKLSISSANPPTSPCNLSAHIKNLTHGAV